MFTITSLGPRDNYSMQVSLIVLVLQRVKITLLVVSHLPLLCVKLTCVIKSYRKLPRVQKKWQCLTARERQQLLILTAELDANFNTQHLPLDKLDFI